MTRRRARRRTVAALAAAALLLPLAACARGDDRTEITFFQFKPEAVEYFEDLAAQFEEQNPDVRVVVQNVPDPETALRTRLVKDDVPDVLTLNGNGSFGEFASAGIFTDFADDPLLDDINPGFVEVVQALGQSEPGAVNGIPFAANASGVLYNEELFAQHGVAVPTTWDELIAAAETFQAAGVTPFYGMLADAWTAQSPLAPLTAQTAPEGFFEERFAGETTFAEGWREAIEKEGQLYAYTQPDPAAVGYQEGTRAFAAGESAMLLLGSYAVPQIRTFEPQFTVGSFALPATDDPARTTLVSGVDVLVTTGADSAHPQEAQRFVEFLLQPDVVQEYAEAQVAIPAIEGAANTDPALAGVQEYIDEQRLVGFTDHQFIPAIPLAPLLQEYLLGGDAQTMLTQLDEDWDKVAARRTWGLGKVQEG
ncbi:ABC transporter substrate-binding protein [Cellulomonas fimi]|uniref:Extracellular solute-binding protein family 1 n=1 Tax=Cellulomonas fimi (strain ATCC 484 / DSM 20113 / JCM 1341 / CCUG 24087 / LMG 16345 / NBRC 15513 / NCIMB 8980 / NCTC 7547 / NRS-133) TaxID=590998 RepID=F4H6T0_CELFA|nr:extracellular solute-binding protein [Cellulomonas fimi]AEE46841.1 extracellular solute-binding protein family 1 [Cellulomonas fimi ATCC 484]NNH06384.1 extracellular solute-binding protein [Cellulomonas fimi]VEH34335.1 glycerol-3-phosphate transporter periplasmic binding protein [Cellulomonas fimi]